MDEITERLAALSPRQREWLRGRLKTKDQQGEPGPQINRGPQIPAEDIHPNSQTERGQDSRREGSLRKALQFSLYFFSDDGCKATDDKYELLLQSAKFADQHGFCAVWTPERHFHDFGGLYPNPSVLSAALAMVTERVQIRAGSVALPLHNPIRVAEEWSIVDNLSKGRVAVSFASGWHPTDFVMCPHKYAGRKEIMYRDIDVIQRLWSGESVKLAGVDGQEVEIRTLPRPLQPRLPTWITSSGSIETWIKAGEIGANLLTGLAGYSFEGLAQRINFYRESLVKHGHAPDAGQVTVMVHTFVGNDDDTLKEKVRPYLTDYMRSHIKQFTPLMLNVEEVKQDDLDAIVSLAFEHYFDTSTLLGTPQKCARLLARLTDIGVDEVACLVDFGLDTASVLDGLRNLNELKAAFNGHAETGSGQLWAEPARHKLTNTVGAPQQK